MAGFEVVDLRLIFASAHPLRALVGRLCRSAPFVNLPVGAVEGFVSDCVSDGEEVTDSSMKPLEQEVSWDGNPTAFEDFFLSVDGEMGAVLHSESMERFALWKRNIQSFLLMRVKHLSVVCSALIKLRNMKH